MGDALPRPRLSLSQYGGPARAIHLARADDGVVIDGVVIDGVVVEGDAASFLAQYLPAEDVLLAPDEDMPYQEQPHLAPVHGNAVIDQVIGAPHATGIFRELAVRDDMAAFTFEGDTAWPVGLNIRNFRMPAGLPSSARHRGGWLVRHHVSLTRNDVATPCTDRAVCGTGIDGTIHSRTPEASSPLPEFGHVFAPDPMPSDPSPVPGCSNTIIC